MSVIPSYPRKDNGRYSNNQQPSGGFSQLAYESLLIIGGKALALFGSLLLVRVLTERLNPTAYGQLALWLTVTVFLSKVITGPLSEGIGRFFSVAKEGSSLPDYFTASRHLLFLATIGTSISSILMVLWLYIWKGPDWAGPAVVTLVFSLLNGYIVTFDAIQNAARQRAVVVFHGVFDSFFRIAAVVALMGWFGATTASVMSGYALSALLVACSQTIFILRLIPVVKTDREAVQIWSTRIWSYSWPFSIWGIFSWIQQVSDRWALATFSGTEDVGRYSVLLQIGYSPIVLATSLGATFIGPILYQKSGDATDQVRNRHVHVLIRRLIIYCALFGGVGVIIAEAFHEQIFKWLVAQQYRDVSGVLPLMVLSGGMFALSQLLALKLMSEMRTAALLWVRTVPALIGVGLSFIGAYWLGMPGVVGASLLFNFMTLAMHLYIFRKRS